MAKKRNPQDATLRNVRSLRKAVKNLESRLSDVEVRLGALIHGGIEEVSALSQPVVIRHVHETEDDGA
jgi:hypothetical protein